MFFPTYDVQFEKSTFDESIIVTGDIKNDSSRDYSLAMFRIFLYAKSRLLGSGMFKVYDFKKDLTKPFRVYVLVDEGVRLSTVSRYEVVSEGGY